MKIYMAMPSSKKFFSQMKELEMEHLLISFAFFKSFAKFASDSQGYYSKDLILDSGAFSVWSRGETIDIDKYATFCKDIITNIPDGTSVNCVNLDVLPGKFGVRPTDADRDNSAQAGWDNMLYLESLQLKVIPVFHQHERFEWLERMMAHTDYIGISPANDVSMKEKLAWLDKCFSITRDKIKTHGFAVTAYDQLVRYPFYSVDSSSWSSGGRYGRIPIYLEGKVQSFNYKNKNDLIKYWSKLPAEYVEIFKTYHDRNYVGILAYKQFEIFVTELWKNRGVIWPE